MKVLNPSGRMPLLATSLTTLLFTILQLLGKFIRENKSFSFSLVNLPLSLAGSLLIPRQVHEHALKCLQSSLFTIYSATALCALKLN